MENDEKTAQLLFQYQTEFKDLTFQYITHDNNEYYMAPNEVRFLYNTQSKKWYVAL